MAPGMPPPPDDQGQHPQVSGPPVKKFGFLGRLLGQKYQEEMRQQHDYAQHLMTQIDKASNDPSNRMPPEALDNYIKELARIMGSEQMPAADIKKKIQTGVDMKRTGHTLAQMQQSAPKPMGVPATPSAVPPDTGERDPNSGAPLQRLTPPPFDQGVPAGGPTPLQNEPAPMAQGSMLGGAGDGVPPPAQNRISRAQLGVEQAAQGRPMQEMEADVKRQEISKGYEARKATYENKPWFKDLTKRQQGAVLSGVNITSEPHFTVGGTTISGPGDKGLDGQDIPVGTPGKRIFMNGEAYIVPEPGALSFSTVNNPDGTQSRVGVNRYTGGGAVSNSAQNSAPTLRIIKITNPDGSTSEVGVNPITGKLASNDPRLAGINPAMLAKEHSGFKLVDQGNGQWALVPVTEVTRPVLPGQITPPPGTATTTPGAPAPTATPNRGSSRVGAAIPVGARSLTPGQEVSLGGKLSAFEQTLGLANSVKANLGLLNSLVDAKKIDLQIDPAQGIVKALVNRAVPLNDKEAQLAADFSNLMEHINTLRIPLGAAGFRGHEAFAALQAQRGQLMANPNVTRRVLENTIKTLNGQMDVLRKGLAGKGQGTGMTPPPANLPPPPADRKDSLGIR